MKLSIVSAVLLISTVATSSIVFVEGLRNNCIERYINGALSAGFANPTDMGCPCQKKRRKDFPSAIGKMTSLTALDLSGCKMFGTIPTELGLLTKLTSLILDYNSLKGTIPSELGNLVKLEDMSFADNLLTGSVPRNLAKLTNLEYLILSHNNLYGKIPKEFGKSSTLRYLYVTDNLFSAGYLPAELGSTLPLIVVDN